MVNPCTPLLRELAHVADSNDIRDQLSVLFRREVVEDLQKIEDYRRYNEVAKSIEIMRCPHLDDNFTAFCLKDIAFCLEDVAVCLKVHCVLVLKIAICSYFDGCCDLSPHLAIYCARYQARPNEKHLKEVKRIFRYLRGTIHMGLWYSKGSGFELTAFSDADHAGCLDTRKSASRGIQFLGDKLVSWMSKKQDCTAMSSAEAEYVALSASCAQVMWMRTQLQLQQNTVVLRLSVSHSNIMQPRAALPYQAYPYSVSLHKGTG
ncbi:hypothetical protein Tco_0808694 [Tanacetum coccineum]